jgi:Tol biopolymer transport system component
MLLGGAERARAGTVLLSATPAGVEGSNNSSLPCVNGDGRFIAFVSSATNLIALDTNAVDDIFLRDLQTATTTRISVSSAGVQANGASTHPGMSADGRYIVFESAATNLVAGKGQGIYLRDTQTSQTTFIATGTAPVISANGNFIAFVSTAALIPADTNGLSDVYVAERATGTLSLVSVATDGTLGAGASGVGGVAISADGSIVAFQSVALNLVPNDTQAGGDVFVRDRNANTTERASIGNDGSQANQGCSVPAISADGNLVAFESGADNLIASDTNTSVDVFVRDRTALTTVRISVDPTGTELANDSRHAVMSADGRYVAFETDSPNAVPGKNNGLLDVLVRDTAGATTMRASLSSTGAQLNGNNHDTAMSQDGRYVAYTTESGNAVPGLSGGVNNVVASGPLVDTPGLLFFTGPPAAASAGLPWPPVAVEARNLDGTRKWDYSGSVTVAIKAGTGRPGAILSGASTVSAVHGTATYTGLSIDKANTGYVLTASSGSLTPGDSPAFDVLQTPTLVAVTVQPSGAAAVVAFTTQPAIEIRDAENNLVASYTGTATVAIKDGTGRAGAILSGTLSVPITGGTAAFTDLALDKAGTGYVLTVSSGTLTPGSTSAFAVAQTPTKLAYSIQPAGASAGIAFTTQPAVQVLDAENNVVTAFTGSVSVAINAGTGRPGAVLSGTTSVNAVAGVATFSGLSIDKANAGYVLTATSGTLTSADSAAFVVAQTPTKLAYSVQPAGASAGLAFTTQPVVQVLDAENNVVTAFTGSVSVAIKAGTGRAGAILSGTTSVNAVAGVATFSGLSIDKANAGYVLTATSGTLTSADSAAFVVAQTPTKLVYALQPGGAVAGAAFTVQPVLTVKDAEDNLVPAYTGSVTVSIKPGTGMSAATLSGTTTVSAVNGVATFTNLAIDLPGSAYVLSGSSGTLTGADSAPFNVAKAAFVIGDVSKALRRAAGIDKATSLEVVLYDIVTTGSSSGAIDIMDAARIARKVKGLEANP